MPRAPAPPGAPGAGAVCAKAAVAMQAEIIAQAQRFLDIDIIKPPKYAVKELCL
jgi:hypothetical protein